MTQHFSRDLQSTTLYRWMQVITQYLDRYYLDAIAGLVPGGWGDAAMALFSIIHLYFSLWYLRSIPLTLAIINNTLRDILLGLIPFYIGDVIDFFHKANSQNMALIDGYIRQDPHIMHEVNRKAWITGISAALMLLCIVILISLLVWIIQRVGSLLFT